MAPTLDRIFHLQVDWCQSSNLTVSDYYHTTNRSHESCPNDGDLLVISHIRQVILMLGSLTLNVENVLYCTHVGHKLVSYPLTLTVCQLKPKLIMALDGGGTLGLCKTGIFPLHCENNLAWESSSITRGQ